MDMDLFKKIIDEFKEMNPEGTEYAMPHFQGEPMVHPQFLEICEYLEKKHVVFSLTSNATLLTKEITDALIGMGYFKAIAFSVDGMSAGTYNKVRIGAEYEKTIENIEYFLSKMSKKENGITMPCTYINFVRLPENEHELEGFLNLWLNNPKIYAVCVNYKTDFNYTPVKFNFVPPRIPCKYYNFYLNILTSGIVHACGGDYQYKYPLGDTKIQTLAEIWEGEPIKKLEKLQESSKWEESEVCKNCICWMYQASPVVSAEFGFEKSAYPFYSRYRKIW